MDVDQFFSFGWLDVTQLLLLLGACLACYNWGKVNGIGGTIGVLLDKKIITEKDLERLAD